MTPITFVYLMFGKSSALTNFSILTFKKFAPENSKFVIYTDQPQYYNWGNSFIEIRFISADLQKDWKGPHNFFWRIKIMAMLDAASKNLGHLFYIDSDTVAFKSLNEPISALSGGACFMHLREGTLAADKAENKVLMWQQVQNKTWQEIKVTTDSYMWNAGVVALSEKDKVRLLSQALSITDEMCAANVTQWLIEQFSLSLVLQNTQKLQPADAWIAHYWGNKEEWLRYIETFFAESFQKNRSLNELTDSIDVNELKKLPINRCERSWKKKLVRFMNKYLPDHVTHF